MMMFLALHPMDSISLNSFVLLEQLAMLLDFNTCKMLTQKLLIGIISFAKPFLNFIDDTMI